MVQKIHCDIETGFRFITVSQWLSPKGGRQFQKSCLMNGSPFLLGHHSKIHCDIMKNQNKPWKSKIFIFVSIIVIVILFFVGFLLGGLKKTNQRIALERLNEAVNMVEDAPEIPSGLVEIHSYVLDELKKGQFPLGDITETIPEAKTNPVEYPAQYEMVNDILYINPYLDIKSEIWLPILYHELTHKWERNTYYKYTPKEHWQNSILELESTAYATTAQAWSLVQRYYPIEEEELTKDEEIFIKSFKDISYFYNELQETIEKESIDLNNQEGWDKLQNTEAWHNWVNLIQSQVGK